MVFYLANGTQFTIIVAIRPQPQQQGNLGWVSYARCNVVFGFQMGRSVQRNGICEWRIGREDAHLCHLHFVLGKRSCLVGTYHRNGTHRFASVQFAYKVVAFKHSAHVQCKAQRYGHRQSFGHGHHQQRYGHHEIAQHNLGHAHVILALPKRIGKHIVGKKHGKSGDGHGRTHLTDKLGQVVELLIEGRFHGRQFGGLTCHLANLRAIAYGCYPCKSATIHHHRRA